MIALLGSLIGFLSSSLPSIFRLFQDKADKSHELELMKLQIEYAKMQVNMQLHAVEMQADEAQMHDLYKTYETGVTWVDALNGTVRPILSYAFFILYTVVKFMQWNTLGSNTDIDAHISVLWTDSDSIIFTSIISFYFGSRYWSKQ